MESFYIRLEILLPASTSAVAMAALKVEFYGVVTASGPSVGNRMKLLFLLISHKCGPVCTH